MCYLRVVAFIQFNLHYHEVIMEYYSHREACVQLVQIIPPFVAMKSPFLDEILYRLYSDPTSQNGILPYLFSLGYHEGHDIYDDVIITPVDAAIAATCFGLDFEEADHEFETAKDHFESILRQVNDVQHLDFIRQTLELISDQATNYQDFLNEALMEAQQVDTLMLHNRPHRRCLASRSYVRADDAFQLAGEIFDRVDRLLSSLGERYSSLLLAVLKEEDPLLFEENKENFCT